MSTQRDVVDLLLDQHHQIKRLFNDVAMAQGERKRDAFDELVRLLAVHESAEEQVVHPAARRQDAEEIVEARLREEDKAKKTLAELYDLGVDHPDFDARLEAFAMEVIAHATHEEEEEFPRLRAGVDARQRERMAGAVQVAEKVAPTRPHPHSGESATANVVAGPPLAVFDRVRDAVRDWTKNNGD
jgi:hemerythrin superfamily protein